MKKKLLVFGYGLGLISLIFGLVSFTKYHSFHWNSIVFFACSFVFFVITALSWPSLEPGYRMWMKGAGFIAMIMTTIILSTVFFLIFTPTAIVLRLAGKDYLQRKLDLTAKTYWQKRMPHVLDKEKYQQQF